MADDYWVAVYDMTLEQIEDRMMEIQRNYSEFVEAAHDGFYISTREGHFLDCNEALVRMLGYRVTEEVLSLDLNTDLWLNPSDRRTFQEIIEEFGKVDDYQAVFKRKDGGPLYVALSSRTWLDRQGRVRGYRGLVVDNTEKKAMEAKLAVSESRYLDLFERMKDGVFISDVRGRVIDCNPAFCEIVGYSKSRLSLMDYYRDLFVSPESVLRFWREVTNDGYVKDRELQIRRKDGSVREVSITGYACRNSSDEVTGYQGLLRDITETKRLYKRLMQSERLSAMGKMASQLAHEVNNPISGIMNCLELVGEALPADHPKKKYLDLAYDECKRTSVLLIKMLKFFKPDDEKRSETDINKIIRETLLFYERQFMNLNIRVVTDLQTDLPMIAAVAGQLKQVLINMIVNANAAMPSGGDLCVASSFDPASKTILIKIRDTGVGIAPESLDKIFDAFFTTKKEVLKGVGLGLSICYGFIREHGGTIDVESEVGKGTCFTIHLPLRYHESAES